MRQQINELSKRCRILETRCVSFSVFSDETKSDEKLETIIKVAESAKSAMLGAMEVLNKSDLQRIQITPLFFGSIRIR